MSVEDPFDPPNGDRETGGGLVERPWGRSAWYHRARRERHRDANFDDTVVSIGALRFTSWLSMAAKLCGPWLDDKLASGVAPDSNALLSARAQILVKPVRRRALAEDWLDLLMDARRQRSYFSPSVPVVRSRVLRARAQIVALTDALRSQLPTSRGVAMASSLLTDGAGPLYNSACSTDLIGAIREVITQLNPLTARD